MSKLKSLKESRAAIFMQIDELRTTTDGREMTSEEEARWQQLLADYEKADRTVEAEERYVEIERRQAERQYAARETTDNGSGQQADEYRSAFRDYLQHGATGVSPESRALFEQRAGLTGLSAGVLVPAILAENIEVALKAYGGMFEAGTILTTTSGGDLILPTVNDTESKATVVAEYQQSTKSAPSFGSVTLKAYTYRTPIVPVSLELLQDSAFDLEALLSGLLSDSFGRGINADLTSGNGNVQTFGYRGCRYSLQNGTGSHGCHA